MDWRRLKANPDHWQIFRLRAEIIGRIRQFFQQEGFLEVQTPILAPALIPESYLEIFETELWDKLGRKYRAFLTPSPELWHKKLLVAGAGRIFEITKSFRNTDLGGHFHNPEFTLLEWYRPGADYQTTMVDCEKLIRFVTQGQPKITYQKKTLDLSQPFERISVIEAFQRYAQIDETVLFDPKKLKKEAKDRDYRISDQDSWEEVFNLIYLQAVEPHLGQDRPTIIYDFPAPFAPLAKTNPCDPRVKERFELYLFGVELADGYSELTDPIEQERQFQKEAGRRKRLGKKHHPIDWDFITALKEGLPACSGVALGVDRLIMILADKTEIKDVILFSGEELFVP